MENTRVFNRGFGDSGPKRRRSIHEISDRLPALFAAQLAQLSFPCYDSSVKSAEAAQGANHQLPTVVPARQSS
jgi:hypothetical protein